MVDRLLDHAEAQGRIDVIADLAYPLPVTVALEWRESSTLRGLKALPVEL